MMELQEDEYHEGEEDISIASTASSSPPIPSLGQQSHCRLKSREWGKLETQEEEYPEEEKKDVSIAFPSPLIPSSSLLDQRPRRRLKSHEWGKMELQEEEYTEEEEGPEEDEEEEEEDISIASSSPPIPSPSLLGQRPRRRLKSHEWGKTVSVGILVGQSSYVLTPQTSSSRYLRARSMSEPSISVHSSCTLPSSKTTSKDKENALSSSSSSSISTKHPKNNRIVSSFRKIKKYAKKKKKKHQHHQATTTTTASRKQKTKRKKPSLIRIQLNSSWYRIKSFWGKIRHLIQKEEEIELRRSSGFLT